MSTTTKTYPTPEGMTGFDVTAIIGHVEFDATGDMSPSEAAMRLIAQHDAQGEYTFPMPDGRTCFVAVEYRDPPFRPAQR